VFAANAHLEMFPGFSPFGHGDPHERADSSAVDADKGILWQQSV
jgi:hypothetical protein